MMHKIEMISDLLEMIFFFQYWCFEFRALSLLGKHSTTLVMPPALFVLFFK
jgi:hypothetical protein